MEDTTKMIRGNIFGLLGVGVVMAAAAIAPTAARADSLQTDKNNMRNLAILGGVAAIYGATHNNPGLAVVGAGAAVVAGSQFNHDQRIENYQSCGPQYYGPQYHGSVYFYGGNVDRYPHQWDRDNHRDFGRYNHGR